MRSSLSRMIYVGALVLAFSALLLLGTPKVRTVSSSTAPALPPAAQFCNASSITINSGGPASPYPSTVSVSGQTGVITALAVTLNGFSHTFPDDVDILLVSPSGQNALIMSDVGGGTLASGLTLTLDDAAATSLPNNGPLVSGTFKPTDVNDGVEIFPSPAPAPAGGSALSVFNGKDPNGTWSLYVKDDTSGDAGSISGWCLDITTAPSPCTLTCPGNISVGNTAGQCGAIVNYPAPTTSGTCGTVTCSPASGTFFPIGSTAVNCSASMGGSCSFTVDVTGTCPSGCNPTSITINTGGAASPYPSSIAISGTTGVITQVTVTLNGFGHTFPDDVDIMLVGPHGQNAMILSDVGGSTAVSGLTITLDDSAATSLPNSSALTSGTFKPTDIVDGAEIFPAPAPAVSGSSSLSVFNGTSADGIWSLYVKDDTAGDGGTISGGWCLNITTAAAPPCTLTCPGNISQPSTAGQCGAIVTYSAPTTSGTCGTVTCSPASGTFFPIGTTNVTCTASAGGSCSFSVTVTGTCPSGCNPTSITINNGGAASPYPSKLAISGVSGTVASLTVTLNGFGHSFPDDVDVMLVGPGGQTAVLMSDVGGATSVNGLTLTFSDSAASNLPDNGPLVPGMFKPTNIGAGDAFPAPAPPSGGSALSVFNGTDPNGTWSLYVVDDTSGDGGSISGGWCLNITPSCTLTCPSNVMVSNDTNQCGAVVNYTAPGGGSCGTVTCAPASGSFFPVGTTTVTCTASSGGSCTFTITVNDTQPPTVTCPANITTSTATGQCNAVVTYVTPAGSDNCPGVTVSCSPSSGSTFSKGTTTVTCTATDASSNTASCSFTVTVNDNQPPIISCPSNVSVTGNIFGSCSANVNPGTATATDNCPGVVVVGVRSDSQPLNSPYPQGTTTIMWTATDTSGNTATCSNTVTVTNPSPVVTISSPASGALFAVNTSVSFVGSYTDNAGGTHTAQWTFASNSQTINQAGTVNESTGSVTASYAFTSAGVYLVTLTVSDGCGGTGSANTVDGLTAMVVIYDPNGGYVTGGGWINSPAGAYVADPTLTGKASFGFVSKYQNGGGVPTGNTEFQFHAASFNFSSTSYEWLVIAGARAQYKGSGTVNGSGDYRFILTAIDGQRPGGGGSDKFRIRIWNNDGGGLVYDNQLNDPDSADPTTLLGGGSIVIHP